MPQAADHFAMLIHSLDGGGAGRRVVFLANALAGSGRRVDLVVLDASGPLRSAVSPGVRVVPLCPGKPFPGVLRAFHVGRLARYLAEDAPDLLMSGATTTHLLAVAACRREGVPLVLRASRHPRRMIPWTAPARRLAERVRAHAARRGFGEADAIIAVSADVAAGLRALLGSRCPPIETILNPITMPAGADADDPVEVSCEPLILGVGRLVRQKDFPTLIRAFALVRAGRPARLALLGEGPRRGDLERLVRRLGIEPWVEMPGAVSDVGAWMRRARLLVSTSLWEGLQATPIEAMMVGCPVVATDCPGGARETLEDGAVGPLVATGDVVGLAAAMCRVLDALPDPARLRASAARFDPEGKAQRYIEVFERVLENRRRVATSSISRTTSIAPTSPTAAPIAPMRGSRSKSNRA